MTRLRLAACCVPPALVALDFAVISVVVPQTRTALHLGDGAARSFFSVYSVSFGCLLLGAGAAADLYGRRRMLLAGLGTFLAGGVVTATAQIAGTAIGGRALQGAGAALMTPAALSLVTSATDGADRTRVLSIYGLATPLGFTAGTLTAGLVAATVGWRAAVAGSLGVACAGLVLAWRLPCDRASSPSRRSPVPRLAVGALVVAASLGALWRPAGIAITAGATALLLVLAGRLGASATGSRAPMVVACTVALAVTATATGATLLQTLFLQDDRGLSATQAGVVFACFGAAAVPGAAVARRGRSTARLVVAGLVLQGLALAVAIPAASTATVLPIVASVAGVGFGSVIASVGFAALATASAPASLHGALVGMLATVQYLGGALGPPLLGRAGLQAGMATAAFAAVAAAGAAALALRGYAAP